MQTFESYNLIDLFIVGTLLITLILGTWKGFFRSLTALAGLVLGVVCAARYYPVLQPYLKKVSALDPHISAIICVVLVFIAVQIVFVIIRKILEKLLDLTRLTWLDRCLGAGMGFTAGFIIVAVAVQFVLVGVPDWPLVKTSKLVQPVDALTARALSYVPEQTKGQVRSIISKWKGAQDFLPPMSRNQIGPVDKLPNNPPVAVK